MSGHRRSRRAANDVVTAWLPGTIGAAPYPVNLGSTRWRIRNARRAGANKRMIYHYFGNKDGLYLAALERVYEELRGTEKTLDLAHLAPEAAIRRLVEFTFD